MDMLRTLAVIYRPQHPPTCPDPSSDSHLPPHFQLRPVMEWASSGAWHFPLIQEQWLCRKPLAVRLEREEVRRSRIRVADGSSEGEVRVFLWLPGPYGSSRRPSVTSHLPGTARWAGTTSSLSENRNLLASIPTLGWNGRRERNKCSWFYLQKKGTSFDSGMH